MSPQSFNLVTQADSRTMKVDSGSMKTIAVMTLFFLPCTAVAVGNHTSLRYTPRVLILVQAIFSTPFFYFRNDSDETSMGISPQFWLIWVISVPLTVVVVFSWYLYQKRLGRRMAGNVRLSELQSHNKMC